MLPVRGEDNEYTEYHLPPLSGEGDSQNTSFCFSLPGTRRVQHKEDRGPRTGDFYETLFTAEQVDSQAQGDMFANLESTFSDAKADLCDGLLTVGEAYKALCGINRSKIPGLDGLPMEFYMAFWLLAGQDLVDMVNHSFNYQQLTILQCTGIITLIHKKDDPLEMKNWRPITLLNVNHKIATRFIAGRLLKVIGFGQGYPLRYPFTGPRKGLQPY